MNLSHVPVALQRRQIAARLRAVTSELGALAQAASDAGEWGSAFELVELAARVTKARLHLEGGSCG